uniref:BREX-1 system adenine-specific DNA-methyltransferase PglX n=1 Tax=Chordicoccus furentiruminis TaxID=2709410 RepID=UPI0023A81F86|nr:BREX-1 system adenine-specific DNA-methyltransferase PglX [Chordicoccus furentiruminis]
MNKAAIKNFAIWARNKLIADISYRAGLMGITADCIQMSLPQSTGTTEFYDIGTAEPYSISGEAVKQRKHLVELIQRKEKETNYKTAYKYVLEEVAYTWFNRLIAVRFMEVNDYLPSHIRVLSSDSGKMEPDLVTNPFDAGLSFTSEEEQTIYQLKQENKLDDVFRILFIKQCNALNENLPALFEKTSDYTELLLNLSVIDQDGVVYHLVHDIPEEDFDVERGGQVEIIGWLYQYYNTEPKSEAFAKKGKLTKEEVPAVTQLFTPDWIVRYMVENSLGRLWVEGHPNDGLKAGWKYYLEEAEQEPEVQAKLAEIRAEYAKLNPEDIKVIDPCMGSGHILVYAFDVLMQIYESAGYGQRDAARSILENNLYGLDIDDRAYQMAYFAVMMKARQYNRRILNGEYKPNVYSIQESNGIYRNQLKYFGAGLNDLEKNDAVTQMTGLLDTFKDAKEYGSILTVDKYDWDLLYRFASSIETIGQLSFEAVGLDDTAEQLKELISQGKALAQKYLVATTNPPYMGNLPKRLDDFAKENFNIYRYDSYSIFMKRLTEFRSENGYIAMVTGDSWLSLSSFSQLRRALLQTNSFVNIVPLGSDAFEAGFGTVMFCFSDYTAGYKTQYIDLSEVKNKSEEITESYYVRDKKTFEHDNDVFLESKDAEIVYSCTDYDLRVLYGRKLLEELIPKAGLVAGSNDLYLRLWFEVKNEKCVFNAETMEDIKLDTWVPLHKGGGFRKWYGIHEYLILLKQMFSDRKINKAIRTGDPDYFFKEGITWSTLSNKFGVRKSPKGFTYNTKGSMCFPKNQNDLDYYVGLLNSVVSQYFIGIIAPNLDFNSGTVVKLPLKINSKTRVTELAEKCVDISKNDWDSFETSWDFKKHPLI